MKTRDRRKLLNAILVSLILTVLVVVGAVYAATVNVDSFNSGTHSLVANSSTTRDASSVSGGSTDVLGDYRDAEVNFSSGTGCDVTLKIDTGTAPGTDWLSFSNESGCKGTAKVTWDGDQDPDTLSYNLGGANLIDDPANSGIYMRVLNADREATLKLTGYENASDYSDLSITINQGDKDVDRLDLFFPFSQFTAHGNGANWASLEALVLDISGDEDLDLTIDFMEARDGPREYGDLPSSYSVVSAYHQTTRGLSLGVDLDVETSENASANAMGDDDSDFDDEDGVEPTNRDLWFSLDVGFVDVELNGCSGTCYVNGWIDWNSDGDFVDTLGTNNASEHIINNVSTSSNSTTNYNFTVPDTYGEDDGPYYARFRVCDVSDECDEPGENASNGEVEDYRWSWGTTAVTFSDFSAAKHGPVGIAWWPAAAALVLGTGVVGLASRRRRS